MNRRFYNTITYTYHKDWRKHGPFEGFESEKEYVDAQLQRLSRLEFLEQISDAIEERLEELKTNLGGSSGNETL